MMMATVAVAYNEEKVVEEEEGEEPIAPQPAVHGLKPA
jgi:hypothetical protein